MKAAAVIAYNAFQRGVKSNALFIGPSGCGKTHIWRCLQKIFPGRIVIEDVSNLTNDGWKGDKKWANLFQSAIFRNGHHNILVLDEADKMLMPKIGSGGNVSDSIQSEGLTMLEGARVDVKINSVIHSIDTSKISFVLCGAFSSKARDAAEKDAGSRIGFGAAPKCCPPLRTRSCAAGSRRRWRRPPAAGSGSPCPPTTQQKRILAAASASARPPSPYSPTSGPWENRTSSTSASCRSSLAVSSGLSTWSP